MSKIIFICFKNRKQNPYSCRDIEILSKRLIPNNISPPPPLIINDNGVFIGIFNPSESLPIKNTSVCMGNLIDPEDNWWEPLAKVPDGSYALFRSDENILELVSDIVASRTVWYIQTEHMFIASTSQRAIVYFLQDFKPNKAAFSWILSSGTLGPGLSWDSRIQCLSGNTRLLLDRSSWELTTKKESANFIQLDLSEEEHEIQLKSALEYIFEHLRLDYSKWVLPLSGGFDSRATLLLMLKNQQNFKLITWGLKSSLNDKNNDAHIARSLAKYFGLEHEYFEIDTSNESIEKIFNRFLIAGEGRIDYISGYMDGFKIWKFLFETKVSGIIRADEGFGVPISTPSEVRRSVGALLFSDYRNLKSPWEFCLEKQIWPKNLQQKKESLATWRDRLYHEFRIPVVLAALTDLKCPYVEVINPLLSRRIIEQVRMMPDSLRTDKRLFKKIVYSMSPKIGIAKYPAIADYKNILKTKKVVNLISNELNTTYARTLLSDKFINYTLENIKVAEASTKNKKSLKALIEPLIPTSLKSVLKNTVMTPQIDYNVLAFRAYIICKMNKILSEDAIALKGEFGCSKINSEDL